MPHHGLQRWLIGHTFYNGLLYNARMTVDTAPRGKLVNKNINKVYAFIKDMVHSHNQWGRDHISTYGALEMGGKHKVDTLDHLNAKVKTLFQKLDKMSVNMVNHHAFTYKICRIVGHTRST